MTPLYVMRYSFIWGDYGYILINGDAERPSRGEPLQLRRTAPFLPPISFPFLTPEGYIPVVSDDLKIALERSGFPDIQFFPVHKAHIVRLDWHLWDLAAAKPLVYPADGTPENYFDKFRHSRRAAASLPDIWELRPPVVPILITQLKSEYAILINKYIAYPADQDYPSIFLSHPVRGYVIVTESGRDWFERAAGGWINFYEIELLASDSIQP